MLQIGALRIAQFDAISARYKQDKAKKDLLDEYRPDWQTHVRRLRDGTKEVGVYMDMFELAFICIRVALCHAKYCIHLWAVDKRDEHGHGYLFSLRIVLTNTRATVAIRRLRGRSRFHIWEERPTVLSINGFTAVPIARRAAPYVKVCTIRRSSPYHSCERHLTTNIRWHCDSRRTSAKSSTRALSCNSSRLDLQHQDRTVRLSRFESDATSFHTSISSKRR